MASPPPHWFGGLVVVAAVAVFVAMTRELAARRPTVGVVDRGCVGCHDWSVLASARRLLAVGAGQRWSVLSSAGRRWSVMVGAGRRWSVLVGAGRQAPCAGHDPTRSVTTARLRGLPAQLTSAHCRLTLCRSSIELRTED